MTYRLRELNSTSKHTVIEVNESQYSYKISKSTLKFAYDLLLDIEFTSAGCNCKMNNMSKVHYDYLLFKK